MGPRYGDSFVVDPGTVGDATLLVFFFFCAIVRLMVVPTLTSFGWKEVAKSGGGWGAVFWVYE